MNFTLIEFLIVVALILLLISLLSPSLGRIIDATRMMHCKNNIKSSFIAVGHYVDDHDGFLPGNCEGRTFGSFSVEVRFKKKNGGRASYSDAHLASFIGSYLEGVELSGKKKYLNELLCPANLEMELPSAFYNRSCYKLGDGNEYFGTRDSRDLLPKRLFEVEAPAESNFLEDLFSKNTSKNNIVKSPPHPFLINNTSFMDGSISEVSVIY